MTDADHTDRSGTETGLPTSFEEAWGVRPRPGYGRKPGLSLPRIVATAVDLASAEGIATVSMVRVARELGVSTMALYRYVASKDELVDLMMDTAMGAPPEPREDEDWRQGLTTMANAYLGALRRHPWILQVPVTAPPITPNQIAWLELGLAALTGTGLGEQEKFSAVVLLSGVVRTWAGLTSVPPADRPPLQYADTLRALLDERRFPAVSAAIAGGAIDNELDEDDDELAFELELVLDGVEALVRRRRPPSAR